MQSERLNQDERKNAESLIGMFELCLKSGEYTKNEAANRALQLFCQACEAANYFNQNVITMFLEYVEA
ncbi:hypothetical protein [Enterococcus faecium]|uniref:hypothetical protein n=1 Tax=Enterococcus faecium TaxID=1352 RepID=UPI000BEF6F61|nr:hypothetical protein [Enterococcus faecium]PEH49588.1 hypothetical protein CRM75_01375 [Enterococcus faecium]